MTTTASAAATANIVASSLDADNSYTATKDDAETNEIQGTLITKKKLLMSH